MSERRFTRGLHKPGSAAQVRETVSQAVRDSASTNEPQLVEPVDFESFLLKNRTILQNDPLREILFFPQDDFREISESRVYRTVGPSVPSALNDAVASLFSCMCIKSYTQNWHSVDYKYKSYSGSCMQMMKLPKPDELEDNMYEVDVDTDESSTPDEGAFKGIIKEGFILKGLDSGSESFISLTTKSFKRRYACLRQEIDGTYMLEFYKDNRKTELKGSLCLDFCCGIAKNSKQSKLGFELRMIEGHKPCILAAENEQDLQSWMTVLSNSYASSKSTTEHRKSVVPSNDDPGGGTKATSLCGTLKGLEHCKHPELAKYARETDYSISQGRKENRKNIFPIFFGTLKSSHLQSSIGSREVQPYKEEFGTKIFVKCEEIKFRLQAPLDYNKDVLCQVEPYITFLSIFDAKKGEKVSEEFRFDINHPYIHNILPWKSRSPISNSSNDSDSVDEPGLFHVKNISREWISFPKQAIFKLRQLDPELFFVLRIEKMLQGSISHASEPYLRQQSVNSNSRLGMKVQKSVRACWQQLGHYRMPFAWAARPIFKPISREFDASSDFGPIYRHEGSKLSDEDIAHYLMEFKRPDKLKNLTVIPGNVKVSFTLIEDIPPNSLTSSLVPLIPFPVPPVTEPTLEVEFFPSENARHCFPFSDYINHLYVLPKSLKYDGQKSFPKARNISCLVEIRDDDCESAKPLQRIYGRPGEPAYVSDASTAVLHHNLNPNFYEEVKILLPPHLHEKHHLFFTFHHVSCELPKGTRKKDGPVASVIGFAWFPLLKKGRINLEEQALPVSVSVPPGYLSTKPFGLGKGYSGPEIRWVDGGKELFRVSFRLISTVLTKDQHLHNFFYHCQRLTKAQTSASDLSRKDNTALSAGSETVKEFSKYVKALHAVNLSAIINFLPTIMNQLFYMMVLVPDEEIASNIVCVLIHIVHSIDEISKNDILNSYIQYVFRTSDLLVQNRVVHEELIKCLKALISTSNSDFLVINKFLQHSWFFYQIISKSMAQHLLNTERIKMLRNERFPASFQQNIQDFSEELVDHVLDKHKDLPVESRQANSSWAFFMKQCLSLMDRGFIFRLLNSYLGKFSPASTKVLHEYKSEFLEIICSHEHFIALNLALMQGFITRGSVKNIKAGTSLLEAQSEYLQYEQSKESEPVSSASLEHFKYFEREYHLSEEYCKYHFLVGMLLSEINTSLSEFHSTWPTGVSILRDLLAKHESDDRYQGKLQQARIASLYMPFISILVENFNQLYNIASTEPIIAPKQKTFNSPGLQVENNLSDVHKNLVHPDRVSSVGSLASSTRKKDSNSLTAVSDQPQQHAVKFVNGSSVSVNSSMSSSSTISLMSHDSDNSTLKSRADSLDGFKCHVRSQSFPFPGSPNPYHASKHYASNVRDALVCFLYIVKNVNDDLLITWCRHKKENQLLDFLGILELSLHQFRYMGKKNLRSQNFVPPQPKSMTLPARTPPLFSSAGFNDYSYKRDYSNTSSTSSETDILYRAILETNLATEVGLIALDVLGLITLHLKDLLLVKDGDNLVMKKIFEVYILILQIGQSKKLLSHLFAALRSFINKFSVPLFRGSAFFCGKLCFELLRCCNSKLQNVQNEACALLYLLMRSNFEFSHQREITRVHLQLMVSVSCLLGEDVNLSNVRLQNSLSLINSYAISDKAMHSTAFLSEVRDLTKRIRTVLMATSQMKEHENDPEMLTDLQYQLANSYASTPALRKTWLESMARLHLKHKNFSEAAFCYIHIAAVEAEYLKQKGLFPDGCSVFKSISPNIEQDESNLKDDTGIHDVHYSEATLLMRLEHCVKLLDQAERYEVISDVYKLVIPIYERQHNYEALAQCYKTLHSAFTKIVEVNKSGKRLLGKYFRVAFFGQAYFDEDDMKEYIYKEPKVTSLAEISERLYNMFSGKFGKQSVKILMDSNQVDSKNLDPEYAYIQVTHVVPYFDNDELSKRLTDFDRNHNLKRFMFETPFTRGSCKARGSPEEQCRRRTILTTSYSFPYLKKRIPVSSKTIQVMSPIEVAIDEIQNRISELSEVVSLRPTDLKKLQLKLQGSVSVQVNAGPIAYAEAFLREDKVGKHPPDLVKDLKSRYRTFIKICQDALDLNERMITSDQYEYHSSLKENFSEFVKSMAEMLKENETTNKNQDSNQSKRTSLEVFSYISGSSGSSTV